MKPWIRLAGSALLSGALLLSFVPAALAVGAGASLDTPVGARAEGMGHVFTGIADGAFTSWWNPAGLAYVRGWNAGLMHSKLAAGLPNDVYFEYATASKYMKGWGGVAFSLTYLTYGEIPATLASDPTVIGTFTPFEFSPSIGLGTPVTGNLSVGANLKFLYVDLAPPEYGDAQGSTFAVDLGALYRIEGESEGLFGQDAGTWMGQLGVAVANLGPDYNLGSSEEKQRLPSNLRVGLSWGARVPESFSVLVGTELKKNLRVADFPDSANVSFFERHELAASGGLELGILDMVFGRVGYTYDEIGGTGIQGWTYGAGFHLDRFGLDFASIPQDKSLPHVTKISLVARFD